jgi:hypothetical protein
MRRIDLSWSYFLKEILHELFETIASEHGTGPDNDDRHVYMPALYLLALCD